MPDDDNSAMTASKAATAAKTTKAPKTVLTVSGKSFAVGQRVIYTDKNGGQFRATVKKHTESTVTEENCRQVKMGILIDGEAALTHVTYPRVRGENEDPPEEGGEEESSSSTSVEVVSPKRGTKRGASKEASGEMVNPTMTKRSEVVEKEEVAGGKKLRNDETTPPVGYMTQAAVRELIAQALQEKAAQDNADMQVMAAQMVQAEAAKGLFDKGTQGDRVQKRNAALESELQGARHALDMALQDRREFRQFFAEWHDKLGGYMDNVLERANRKMPGEED
jgi:hypothetical protein